MRTTLPGACTSAMVFAALALFVTTGCGMAGSGFDSLAAGTDVERPVEQTVTIAFRNLATTDAVNVEFHTTTAPVASLPDGLFIDDNRVTASLGVAATGLLLPGATDVLVLPCEASLIIGTAGGAFLDNESGESTGRGDARWLDATSAGLCGATVGFTFEDVGDTFATTVEIRR